MSYKISYQPIVLEEYEDAMLWYRSEQAAENFVLAVQSQLDVLRKAPDRYRKTYRDFREAPIKKYPYSIVYFIEETGKSVIITSVYNNKRNSRKQVREIASLAAGS